jgi:hypothetical protein
MGGPPLAKMKTSFPAGEPRGSRLGAPSQVWEGSTLLAVWGGNALHGRRTGLVSDGLA